ncbi:Rapamycin-insensitive companion of mTOR, N-term-domain-containing protein [Limtongia smithiae]|uniref:Rapamycin-insensitive companion of mTOR, N-term-domain-containing protein n=1 Tax=Limtongia smithiae TaxID=1125753 RepID=UPI0034CF94BB
MIKLERINTNFERAVEDEDEDDGSLGSGGSPTWVLGDILQSLEEPDKSTTYLVSKTNELVALLQRYPDLKSELVLPVFGRRVQKLLSHSATEVMATGYRTARYAITDLASLKAIINLKTDAFVIRSLAKEQSFNLEREQAIKFIRGYMEVPEGVGELSLGVLCALVAVAEEPADKLNEIALETLAELLLFDPSKVSAAGGIKVLTQALAKGSYELSDSIMMAFLFLLDMPSTRQYIWAGIDLEAIMTPFAELQDLEHIDEAKIKGTARVLSITLKSWCGLFYMCMFDLAMIRSVVQSMRLRLPGVREIIMDFLFEIFSITKPEWSTPYLAGRRLTSYVNSAETTRLGSKAASTSLRDQYVSLLLAVFIEAELLQHLLIIIQDNLDDKNTRKATLLLGEIITLSADLMPQRYAVKTQVLGPLFASASRFGSLDRFAASSTINQIDRITRNLYHALPDLALQVRGEARRETRASELKKMRLGLHLDDTYFRNMLLDTNVLSTKNYTKWNWDTLIELMQGPLLNPRRLDEAIRATKFMKRLMSFYRPFKYRFSEIRRSTHNERYVRAGGVLIKTLLANPEGVKYLMENKLLRQIAECLAQLDPASGITSAEPLFSRQRLETTLSYGYFRLVGILTASRDGVAMVERWRIFNMFYHMTELGSRKDLLILLISSLDYHLDGHPRILLEKVLTTCDKEARLFATSYVATLIDYDYPRMHNWAIRLLVEQLYDVDQDVRELAVKSLGDACDDGRTSEYLVAVLPDMDRISDVIAPLLLRFLATPEGFKFLSGLDFVEREMDLWFTAGINEYVQVVERELAQALFFGQGDNSTAARAVLPTHFYRELIRTDAGCKLLRQKDHVHTFCTYIKENSKEFTDLAVLTKLKACLWAIGNIASLASGIPFLEESDIVGFIVDIAFNAQVWSLRGTAYFVIGLIASTAEGFEMVDEFGWETALTVMGEPLGLSLPIDIKRFVSMPPWTSDNVLRPSRRGVYVADQDVHNLKQIVVAQQTKKPATRSSP